MQKHIELLTYLQDKGGADLLPTTIDSYTRQNRYKEAEVGIEESIKTGKSMLNGFPAVNHGVAAVRQVVNAIDVPLQIRHGTPDARLLTEIVFAGGYTSYEGGGISYNIPYAKSVPLERTIADWQYCDRLTGIYEEAGISINREPYGPLTGTLVPPSISHAVAVIEALLAAEQGVKNITVGYGQCGNLIQDVAAIHTLESLTEEYLHKYGYDDVVVTTVLHQWMGGFPQDEAQAFGVISWGSAAAALAMQPKSLSKPLMKQWAFLPQKPMHRAFAVPNRSFPCFVTNLWMRTLSKKKKKLSSPKPNACWINALSWAAEISRWVPYALSRPVC